MEGIPLTSNRAHVAERALSKLGRIVRFDDACLIKGPEEFIRSKGYIKVNKPLIPGYFYEYMKGFF